MNVRRGLLLALIVAASAGTAGRASAQGGYGCGGGYGYGFGAWDVGRLYEVLARNVPYYSAFPPVYYSLPVPRTYGYSPFAYPPGVMTPDVVCDAAPASIVNPYFSQNGEAATTTTEGATEAPVDRTTSVKAASPQGEAKVQASTGPLVIVNPYFERGTRTLAGR